jgi:outer membrane immunogenic protein
MKNARLCALALFSVFAASPTMAADLPVKARPMPAAVPLYDWNGFYIGGNGGYSWGRSETDVAFFALPAGTPIVAPAGSIVGSRNNMNGWIAGGQIGFNWQSGAFLFGLEGDGQWSGQSGSATFLCAATTAGGPCLPGLTFLPGGVTGTALGVKQDLEWFATGRVRVGWLPAPTWLLYATGGVAFGEVSTTGTTTGFNPNGVLVVSAATVSETRVGWTAGAGLEGVISGPWTAKLEYLYMDLGSTSGSFVTATTPLAVRTTFSSSVTDHILRAGLNYRFTPGRL